MLFSSCQKDDERHRDTVTLKAIIADPPNTSGNSKVYIDTVTENGVMTYYSAWHNGDKVNINGTVYELEVAAGNRGNALAATISGVEPGSTGSFVAAYPSTSVVAEGNLSPTVSVADTQVYKLTSVHNSGSVKQEIASPMVGYCPAGSDTIKFHNAAGIIKVTVSNTTGAAFKVHYITVTADGQYLAGSGAVSGLGTSVPVMAKPASGSKTITLDCCGEHPEIANGGSAIFYVVTAPFNDQTLTFNVMAEDESKTKYTFTATTNRTLSLENNKLGSVTVSITSTTTHTSALFWGEGTKTCPYLITNLDDLKLMRDIVNYTSSYNNSSYQTAYNTNTRYYRQTDSIALASWLTAIGTNTYPFAANYDGGGHSITCINNIAVFDYAGASDDYSIIKNLTVAGNNKNTYESKHSSRGGLVNIIPASTSLKIERCTSSVTIACTTYTNDNARGYGGIVGEANGNHIISYCCNSGKVVCDRTNSGYTSQRNKANYGGIVGISTAGGTIKSCSNLGLIGSDSEKTSYQAYRSLCAGGIVGHVAVSNYSISNCENSGDIRWTGNQKDFGVGGICGRVSGTMSTNASAVSSCSISGCINSGNVIGVTSVAGENTCLGGICGWIYGGSGHSISNCTNAGNVTFDNGKKTPVYIGGVLGCMGTGTICSLDIKNCNNASAAVIQGSNGSAAYTGGILGYSYGHDDGGPVNIINCFNAGSVTRGARVGGIAGHTNRGKSTLKIYNCYSQGTITSSFIGTDNSTNSSSAGGIVGSTASASTLGLAINCYSVATVTSSNAGTYDYVGAIAGRISVAADIVNCYGLGANSYGYLMNSGGTPGYTQFSNYGTISEDASALLNNLNSWVNSANDGDPGTGTYSKWKQNENEYPHF